MMNTETKIRMTLPKWEENLKIVNDEISMCDSGTFAYDERPRSTPSLSLNHESCAFCEVTLKAEEAAFTVPVACAAHCEIAKAGHSCEKPSSVYGQVTVAEKALDRTEDLSGYVFALIVLKGKIEALIEFVKGVGKTEEVSTK
jgi:hypothetical protein